MSSYVYISSTYTIPNTDSLNHVSRCHACCSVKPAIGTVPAQDFQLVELRFTPQQPGMHRLAMPIVFNNSDETSETLSLMGLGQTPSLRSVSHSVSQSVSQSIISQSVS